MDSERSVSLVRLEDSGLRVANPAADMRGRVVVDREGDEIGDVKSLIVDEQDTQVRFLEVKSGGLLGLGGALHLVPVDAVTRVEENAVHVDLVRDHVRGAPVYEPRLDDAEGYYSDVYDYYGYRPYWNAVRSTPPFPY